MRHARTAPTADTLNLAPEVALARARAHEVTGAARIAFALWAAAAGEGPVLWLQPSWGTERLMGDGVRAIADPTRLLFGRARGMPDLLWAAEEALRSGAVPLVVAELPQLPALTPVRRLHLAAEAGAGQMAEGEAPPLLLILTQSPGGAPGVESRWQVDPAPGWAVDGRPAWRLVRLRARMAPETAWTVRLQPSGRLRMQRIREGTE